MILICIVGETGSGKTTIERHYESLGAYRVVSYTTRNMRVGEVDGIDYYFISKEKLDKYEASGDIVEYTEYAGNYYCTLKSSFDDYKVNIMVVEPNGLRQLQKVFGNKIQIIYVSSTVENRIDHVQKREGQNQTAVSRLKSDSEIFKGMDEEADHIIYNNGTLEELLESADRVYRKIVEETNTV